MRETFLPVPGARLYLREIGAGTPLVVLHGGPDFNHHYLLPEMDVLASAFRLLYYDQRGRGRSSGDVTPEEVSIDSEIEDLDRARRHLGTQRVGLLGHSWGALLAMEYAARRPEHVRHLILMNPAPGSHDDLVRFRAHRQATESGALEVMRQIAATPAFAQGDVETEARYYRAHFGATLKRREDLERVIGRLRVHFTPHDILKARAIEDRLYAQTWSEPGYDVIARLAGRAPPTLVIHGALDFIPLECASQVAGSIPGARLVLIGDCGHFAFLERPEEVQRAILDFAHEP